MDSDASSLLENRVPPSDGSTLPPVKKIRGNAEDVEFIKDIMIGVVIVLFIGFIGALFTLGAIVIDAWNSKSNALQNLQDEVQTQSAKIDTLSKQIESSPAIISRPP